MGKETIGPQNPENKEGEKYPSTLDEYMMAIESCDGSREDIRKLGTGENWKVFIKKGDKGDYEAMMKGLQETGKFRHLPDESQEEKKDVEKRGWSTKYYEFYTYTGLEDKWDIQLFTRDTTHNTGDEEYEFRIATHGSITDENADKWKDVVLTILNYIKDNEIPSKIRPFYSWLDEDRPEDIVYEPSPKE